MKVNEKNILEEGEKTRKRPNSMRNVGDAVG